MSELETLLARLATSEHLAKGVEEATRQAAVIPVLDLLQWDWRDLAEVWPEYGVGTGRVDYALRGQGKTQVFIEVKRTGLDLDGHQEQLLRYAFTEGVPLAVLTDGLVWWLYLPLRQGSWEERKFFSLDLRRVEATRAAVSFQQFLGRDAVLTGRAVQLAEEEIESRDRQNRIRHALPIAWSQLLAEA